MADSQLTAIADLQRGAAVRTSDGEPLGTVGETRPTHFLVEGAGRKDYWVARDDIATASSEHVLVGFPLRELDRHSRSDPGAAHVVGATSTQTAYIRGATPADANELADPNIDS